MAGRGPAPKHPDQRRSRHRPQRGEWVELEPLTERILPELPPAPPRIIRTKGAAPIEVEQDWSARTRAAWEAWAKDPITAVYTPADLAAAIELAYVMEDFVRGVERPSEVRLRMDGLGLGAKGKRDLRYRVAAEHEPAAPRARVRPRAAKRRARLSLVGGDPKTRSEA